MIIKLLTNTITATKKRNEEGSPGKHKCELIMNSDSTATLTFYEILEYKELNLLSLIFKMGDADQINNHVTFRYKLVKHQLKESKSKL